MRRQMPDRPRRWRRDGSIAGICAAPPRHAALGARPGRLGAMFPVRQAVPSQGRFDTETRREGMPALVRLAACQLLLAALALSTREEHRQRERKGTVGGKGSTGPARGLAIEEGGGEGASEGRPRTCEADEFVRAQLGGSVEDFTAVAAEALCTGAAVQNGNVLLAVVAHWEVFVWGGRGGEERRTGERREDEERCC